MSLFLWQNARMGGAVIMIILLVVVMPIAILLSGALAAAVIGGLVKKDVDKSHEESELLELSESNPWLEEKTAD